MPWKDFECAQKRIAWFTIGSKLCESTTPLGCHEAVSAEQEIIQAYKRDLEFRPGFEVWQWICSENVYEKARLY